MHFQTNAFTRRATRVVHLATGAGLLAAVAMALIPQTMRAQVDPLVIDNFKTGGFKAESTTGTKYYTQTGTGIYGGTRNINLVMGSSDAFAQPVQVQVRPQPKSSATPSAFIVSGGFGAFAEVDLYYEATGESLNLNLAPYNRIRVTFAGLTSPQAFFVNVYDNTGNYSEVECNIGPFAQNGPVGTFTTTTVDIPEENFGPTSAGPVNWGDIEAIVLEWAQAGSADYYGVGSFAVKEVSALMASDPVGTVTCGAPAN
jgi:hypothetical protein